MRYIIYLHHPSLVNPDYILHIEMIWWLMHHPSLSYTAYVQKAKGLGLAYYTEEDYNRKDLKRYEVEDLLRKVKGRPDYKWGGGSTPTKD